MILSHIHHDHTGGLEGFLGVNRKVKVFLPKAFPERFKKKVRSFGVQMVETDKACRICEGAWPTGVLSGPPPEQGLCLETAGGLVVVTGCAHPGVVRMVEAAGRLRGKPLEAVLGGFHMAGVSNRRIVEVIAGLRKLGVQRVGPCHCSSERTRQLMA